MASENDILKIKIQQLEAEKENWLQEKVFAVQKIKKVEPPDYQENKKRIKFLEKKCKSLEDILRFGHISSIATLIEEYQSLSKTYLDKISVELEFYYASAEERMALLKFITYLQFIEQQLQQFLIIEGEENGTE